MISKDLRFARWQLEAKLMAVRVEDRGRSVDEPSLSHDAPLIDDLELVPIGHSNRQDRVEETAHEERSAARHKPRSTDQQKNKGRVVWDQDRFCTRSQRTKEGEGDSQANEQPEPFRRHYHS